MASHVVLHGAVFISNATFEGKRLYSYDVHIPTLGPDDIIGRAHLYVASGSAQPEDGFYRVSGRVWQEDVPCAEIVQSDDDDGVDGIVRDHAVCCRRGPSRSSTLHILFNDLYVEDPTAQRLPPTVDVMGRVTRSNSDTHCVDIDVAQFGLHSRANVRTHCFYPPGTPRLQGCPLPGRDSHTSMTTYVSCMVNGRLLLRVIDISLGPKGPDSSIPSSSRTTMASSSSSTATTSSPWDRRNLPSSSTSSVQPVPSSSMTAAEHVEDDGADIPTDEKGKGKKRKKDE